MRHLSFLLLITFLIASCGSQSLPTTTSTAAPTPTPLRQPTDATADCPLDSPPAEPVHNLTDLLPGCDYAGWFEANTSYEPDDSYFGGYSFLPWEDALYLGFGKARPAEFNGALFSKYKSNTLTAIYQPSEQGFIDMTPDVTRPVIHIPGVDPTDPAEPGSSQWDWGNTYVYTPTVGTITKHRNLPDVIHTWGMASTATRLYAATSAHEGDYKTWTGEVFFSDDLGEHWELIADKTTGVGDYRTYDITQFNGKLYVVWNDAYGEPCGLAESEDEGFTWQRLSDFTGYTHCRTRLFVYDNQLLILGSARDGILALQPNGSINTHLFPDFLAQDWVYNPFAVDAQNRLYIVAEDDRILRTADLENWETIVASDRDFITLAYWPDIDRIAVGDRGVAGRVWLLNPEAAGVERPPAPEPTISLSEEDVRIHWQAENELRYRIYRYTTPAFTPPIEFFYDTTTEDEWTDPDVDEHPGGVFYQVRSQNTVGDISSVARTMGKFTFELTPGT